MAASRSEALLVDGSVSFGWLSSLMAVSRSDALPVGGGVSFGGSAR